MQESRRSRARRLGKLSWQLLREDRRLVVFPLVSAGASVLLGAIAFGLAAGFEGTSEHNWRAVFVIAGIVVSFPVTFVTLFSGVALATVLARKLDGETVSASDGWRAARERSGIILAWTLLVCTVGAILRLAEQYLPIGGRIAAFLLDLSWTLATMFAVPVLAYEGLGPRATLSRSAEIFKARWGEQVGGVLVIGFGTAVLIVPAIVILVAGFAVGGVGGIALIAVGGAFMLAVGAYSMALNQVFRVVLYRSAVGASTGPFSADDLAQPFRPRRTRWAS
jgi:Family of unknown function (DUF6159)